MGPRYSIHQTGDNTWELRNAAGDVVGEPFVDRPGQDGYEQACGVLGVLLAEQRLAAGDGTDDSTASGDGLLAERWVSDQGLCFSEDTPGGRDFSQCTWSWRDPATSLVPLMFMSENTDWGHLGAELAGFVEEFHMDGTTPAGSGRFYDTEIGVQARDTLLGGRSFGVSVDPSENVEVEYHDECVEQDEDGWCTSYSFSVIFTAYEIAGVTMCPFPCFENAGIKLDASGAASTRRPVRASVLVPTRPPREWMTLAEPEPGHDFLDDLTGDDVLVPQRDRAGNQVTLACPMTLRDDALVYGHLTTWGQCHTGDPWGPGVCASASPSSTGYADFLTGQVVCDDGSTVATGALTVGCEHSFAFTASGVRDHLAHAGMGWADVHVVDGVYGPWLSGVLRPGITDDQLRVLRSLSLSGEWVGELAGILAVNVPGLPVQRALAASAFAGRTIPVASMRASAKKGGLTSLVGANIVAPCPECQKRLGATGSPGAQPLSMAAGKQIMHALSVLERRTRHLVADEAASASRRLAASRG